MDWHHLLNKSRIGTNPELSRSNESNEGRSEFQRDYDRIVFSSAFRRLQDKTQVFPLPESDFVHTRLTHSLEVSCIGRSLGNIVGGKILERYPKLNENYTKFHFGEIVAASCLAHDIGNPPFGHSGEDAIAEYFKNGNGKNLSSGLSPKQYMDLIKFEGNAQGFRIISRLQNPNVTGGLQLTYATLAAFAKYPKESIVEEDTLFATEGIRNSKFQKKFGFFQSEKELFSTVAKACQMTEYGDHFRSLAWRRHPLAFLVEAADDICYRIIDLEDGFRLGLISFKETEEFLTGFLSNVTLNSYDGRDNNDKIGYLRAKVLSRLVTQLSEIFLDEETSIMSGSFPSPLIEAFPGNGKLKEIKNISKERIYSYSAVIERETAGYEVLGGLLDIFITAVNDASEGRLSNRDRTTLKLLPTQFLGPEGIPDVNLYTRLLKITDFVSGMTDSYAVSLYRKLKGISLPGH
jgi:dGTPase